MLKTDISGVISCFKSTSRRVVFINSFRTDVELFYLYANSMARNTGVDGVPVMTVACVDL